MKKIFLTLIVFFAFCGNSFSQSDTNTALSGLKYLILEEGDGPDAESGKAVEVHYTGYLLDGKKFDSSLDRNEPIMFVLGAGQVIKGWDEGISLMNVGDKMRLIIPSELAYGNKGAGDIIPPDATLVFDVELVSVGDPKTSIAEVLLSTIVDVNVQAAISQYKELKANEPDIYNFKESELNKLGYQLFQIGKIPDALEILKLNVEMFPNSSNVYDSLGEAYKVSGNNELAIVNYNKSLELNPENENAKNMLKELEGK
ncbi:MAG TPA: FKBP-type peptidyl-prolyl cis-trans isomerase [Ignavibacteria bacterium]|nr:FKBP-type peptidyl-prolyl cis-trans isomerase [Ignavibacteria bacterium]HQY51422.1 FKBP-type peptidyl-prolyl cis-trans isomerase [Ignavibacteria bacterium]HRA99248.1 FKBP-type peptidyl-prolyl cis-trans isomerase [Ignavibacteria bacterium]